MECAEARSLLERKLDAVLQRGQNVALEAHLGRCPPCRDQVGAFRAEETVLRACWPSLTAPPDFAHQVVNRLPPRPKRRAPLRRTHQRVRWAWTAAAVLSVLLAASAIAQPAAWASLTLALKHVVLREAASSQPPASLPMGHLSLEQAQQLIAWRIRQPSRLPPGYQLVAVEANEVHAFAAGPTIVLHYQKAAGQSVQELSLVELRATAEVSEPVQPDAARQVPVGDSGQTGLFIDGSWEEQDGRPVWQRGTLVRFVVEQGDVVIQLQADPRDDWDAQGLAQVAASLQ